MKMDDIDLFCRVMPEHEAIHARLENWERWSKDKFHYKHCASAEWRYRSPPNDDDRQPRIIWDSLDADVIHRLICGLPYKHRRMLSMWYITKPSAIVIRKSLGLTRDGAVKMINDARQMLKNKAK